jgi:apolipoprotein N-acyltransferase
VQALEMGVFGLLYRVIRPKSENPLLCGTVFTALWVIFEWQQNFFWRGVPFARLSLTQANAPIALQSASLFGNLFVSGLIVFINVLLFVAAREAIKNLPSSDVKSIPKALKNKKTAIFALVALGIFSLNTVFGAVRIATLDTKKGEPIKAAVIQANISSLEKWGGFYDSLDVYTELTVECVSKTGATLVVWPETVLPAEISNYSSIMEELCDLAKEQSITLFVGSFDATGTGDDRKEYNAIYLFYPDGTASEQRYYKQRLVPFGEYNPIGPLLALVPSLDVLGTFNDPLTPGDSSELFDTEYGKIGSIICFDSIYDYLVRQSVNDGAEIITLSTNDSWFSDSTAVYQHNRHAQVRAIENGRYIIRAASTGMSSFISPTGQILDEIAPLTKGYATCEVYALQERTVYSYVGDIFVYICLGFAVGMISYRVTIYFKNKKGVKENDSSKS